MAGALFPPAVSYVWRPRIMERGIRAKESIGIIRPSTNAGSRLKPAMSKSATGLDGTILATIQTTKTRLMIQGAICFILSLGVSTHLESEHLPARLFLLIRF